MSMSTGLHYLDLGIGVAVFLGIFWWMYALTSRSHAQRKLELSLKKIARQPWDEDGLRRRGIR